MTSDTAETELTPTRRDYNLGLGWTTPFSWLMSGWRDMWHRPVTSLLYGLVVFAVSAIVILELVNIGAGYLLLSAFAGFMIIAPALASGLYEKSRRLAEGKDTSFGQMVVATLRPSGQIFYVGAILGLLMVLWFRAAFLLYALVFGMTRFDGFDQIILSVLTTPTGWLLLAVGSLVGGLFAAFSFAISVFSIPMLLDQKIDAFTAMGTSMAFAWNNMVIATVWGAVVVSLFLVSIISGLVGLIIIYPLLGHATWHAYAAVKSRATFDTSHE